MSLKANLNKMKCILFAMLIANCIAYSSQLRSKQAVEGTIILTVDNIIKSVVVDGRILTLPVDNGWTVSKTIKTVIGPGSVIKITGQNAAPWNDQNNPSAIIASILYKDNGVDKIYSTGADWTCDGLPAWVQSKNDKTHAIFKSADTGAIDKNAAWIWNSDKRLTVECTGKVPGFVLQATTAAVVPTTVNVPKNFGQGKKLQIRNAKSQTCLTYKGNSQGFVGSACDGGLAQQFKFSPNENGEYTISHEETGLVLSIQNDSNDNGAIVWSFINGKSDYQFIKVTVVGNDKYSFQSVKSQKCVDLENGDCSVGAKVQQWACDTNNWTQLWQIEISAPSTPVPVDPTPLPPSPTPVPDPVPVAVPVTIKNVERGLCATYKGNMAGLIGEACVVGNKNQIFVFVNNKDNTFSILHNETKFAFDIQNEEMGSKIWTATGNQSTSQKYQIVKDGIDTILKNTKTGRCVDMNCRTAQSGISIDQWECQGNNKFQRWIVEAVAKPAARQVTQTSQTTTQKSNIFKKI